jgi:hypothetical protein
LQGCDSLVFGFDGERLPAYLGADSTPLHLWHLGADVNLRYPLDALFCECSVVNPGTVPCALKCAVGVLCPLFAPLLQQ